MSLASNFRNILEVTNRKLNFKLDKDEAKDTYASKASVDSIANSVNSITSVIPSSASSSNKLITLSDLPIYNGGVSNG